ncbi:MAG: nuclear transport factor 2 family protein [Acidobacteria bacterium]|nr:nuclear transport factor 2 family protein [Acidobacteriota bacterium]
MKRFIVMGTLVSLVSLVISVLLAQGTMAQAVPGQLSAVEQMLIQMEKDAVQAWLKKDVAVLDRLLADDFVLMDYTGKTSTKADILRDVKSGSTAAQSVELGPMKVRVFGQAAVVSGSQVEKSTLQGKDSSGSYVWTNVFVNRNGRWQVVSWHFTRTK